LLSTTHEPFSSQSGWRALQRSGRAGEAPVGSSLDDDGDHEQDEDENR